MASKSNKTQDQPEGAGGSFLQSPKRFQAFLGDRPKKVTNKRLRNKKLRYSMTSHLQMLMQRSTNSLVVMKKDERPGFRMIRDLKLRPPAHL